METILPEDIMEKSGKVLDENPQDKGASKHVIEIDLFKELGDAIEASIIMKVKQMVNPSAPNPYAALNISVDTTDYEKVKIIPMSPVSIEITNFESENENHEHSDSRIKFEKSNEGNDQELENQASKDSEHTDDDLEVEIPKQPDLDISQIVLSQGDSIKDQNVTQNEHVTDVTAKDVEDNEAFDQVNSESVKLKTNAENIQGSA